MSERKRYAPLWVSPDVKKRLKTRASMEDKTITDYMDELVPPLEPLEPPKKDDKKKGGVGFDIGF